MCVCVGGGGGGRVAEEGERVQKGHWGRGGRVWREGTQYADQFSRLKAILLLGLGIRNRNLLILTLGNLITFSSV